MKLFASRSYVNAPPPVPKMPPGLIELMEGLTKDVLKNNPTEVYGFCAEHMRKLLELRDNDTSKGSLTLEQKVSKANNIIRQRAEKRRRKYDNDTQMLQHTEQSTFIPEEKCFETECRLAMKEEENLLHDNLKQNDELLNNDTISKSEDIKHKESNEKFVDEVITSEGVDEFNNQNEQQVKSNNQINKNIDNNPINLMQYKVGDNNTEEISAIATVSEDNNKADYSKERDADDSNDVTRENNREEVIQQEDIENQSQNKNNDVNDKEFTDKRNNNKREENENYEIASTIVNDDIVAVVEINQESISSGENGLEEIKEIAVIKDENEKEIEEQFVSNDVSDQNEIKEGAVPKGENNQKESEQPPVTNEDGIQIEIKEEVVINGENNQKTMEMEEHPVNNYENEKEIEEEFVSNYVSDQNEIKEGAVPNGENNQKESEQQPVTNEEGDQIEIKEEVVINGENNQNTMKMEEHPVIKDESNQNKIKDEGNFEENNQKEIIVSSVANDEDEQKENEEHIIIHDKNEPEEPAVTAENEAHVDTNNDNQKEIDTNNSNYKNVLREIKEQDDMHVSSADNNIGYKSISVANAGIFSTMEGQNLSDKNLEDEIIKTMDKDESIMKIDEAKSDNSQLIRGETVLKSTEDISKNKTEDKLNIIKAHDNEGDPEDSNDVSPSVISDFKEPELAPEHADFNTPSVSNSEYNQIKAEPLHLDQLPAEKNLAIVSEIKTENNVDEIIDTPLIINIDLQQNNQNGFIGHTNQSKDQIINNSINNFNENDPVESKEFDTVEPKNSKPMDLETAAITIQKVFRNFLFRSKTSSLDDLTNIEFNIFDHDSDSKDTVYSNQSQILNKDKRPIGISRMDTVLQTVNEEKSLSLSTDDSSTLSSAATVIQAHIRGFLVRNRLNRNKTISSTSLADSDDPPASFEADPDPGRNKTVLNIHIVPEGSHFLSRDESMLTSVELSLDSSPPASSNLHPLGYDISERRKQLKREDAVQSISPPSNNSTRLSEEHDSVKEVLLNEDKNETHDTVNDELPAESTTEDSDSDDVLSKGTVEEKQIENPDPVTTSNKKSEIATIVSSDELDVITPFGNVEEKNHGDLDNNKLVHSGEFHDVVLPTKVSRNDTSVVRDFQNVLVYFLVWNNS